MLTEDDLENLEMNYIEYIRGDLEGVDVDTRRRAISDFLKNLVT